MFRENPESMIGQSLFEDELPYVRRFIEVFEPFADAVPDEFSFGRVDKSKIDPPLIVIKRAKELYEKLLEQGDPKIEQYKK